MIPVEWSALMVIRRRRRSRGEVTPEDFKQPVVSRRTALASAVVALPPLLAIGAVGRAMAQLRQFQDVLHTSSVGHFDLIRQAFKDRMLLIGEGPGLPLRDELVVLAPDIFRWPLDYLSHQFRLGRWSTPRFACRIEP